MMSTRSLFFAVACACLLSGCVAQSTINNNPLAAEAQVTDTTRAGRILAKLPPPKAKVPVVVYDFQDQTGQFKNNGQYTDYSSAVTKGGYSILIKSLLDAGNREWFTVVERGSLKNLLQERQIIKLTREQYVGPEGTKLPNLPPMLYGGMMIEGGIISYDSNVVTGGAGAAFLGISASTQYRRDLVSVYLRAVNVQTGEVILSVTSSKTIYSTSLDSNLLKYMTIDHLLQAEAGVSVNEPVQLGVRQAVETAVYSLIMEGAIQGLWEFADAGRGKRALDKYIERRDNKSLPEPSERAGDASHADTANNGFPARNR
jgi:curli production assembly/transport component CsgG